MLDRLRGDDGCRCRPTVDGDRLVLEADDCPGGGVLEHEPACRETVVTALADHDVRTVLTRAAGVERAYEDDAAALLVAAGRFADAVAFHDASLAARARTDPLRAASDAAGRSGVAARLAAETGLLVGADRVTDYEDALRPAVGPTVAHSRVVARPPPDARLVGRDELETGATVRWYRVPGEELPRYHLAPVERTLGRAALRTLASAADRLARGSASGGARRPRPAVLAVADAGDPVERLVSVLAKHTRGFGVLEDLFATPDCSDVFVTAPVGRRPLRARIDDRTVRTNVRLTERGVETLASRFRRRSGRAFSRSTPTLDAVAEIGGRRVRVAGVTTPVSDGTGFALRAHDRSAWTLPALVANGTLPPDAAAVLSLAVERGANCLFVGARGAGKTTALGACCFELPAATRAVVIEDTPELPVTALSEVGRDVQALHVDRDGETALTPTGALRSALRLGEGALVVGEVRGAEASALFEAMRVGTTDGAVLGTVHGDGGDAVRARVVDDLGVVEGAFGAVDLVVTLGDTADGRRVTAVEEVTAAASFVPLYQSGTGGLSATGRLERGDSRLLATLLEPGETYTDGRDRLAERADWLEGLAREDRTDAEHVVDAHATRRTTTTPGSAS